MIFLPGSDELFLYAVTSKVTSDCLVDRLFDWWETVKERFSHIKTLLINLYNGPENQSRRTQFMQRLLQFVQRYRITIRLAYYPPYHSKYIPIERCWGILEQHWNEALLDSVDIIVQ
jgi:transposase